MSDFFRFPHTAHLAWLGTGAPRDDKVLDRQEAAALLASVVLVEEKVDGANIGISLDASGALRVQNRGQYLQQPYSGQFSRLQSWLDTHRHALLDLLSPDLILFGEWLAALHSVPYAHLPDWFLLFDVWDKPEQKFWSTQRRNQLAELAGLQTVPLLTSGHYSLKELQDFLRQASSRYSQGPLEGVMVRRENVDWCEARAKLVQPDFTQAIEEHWSKRGLQWNRVADQGSSE
jgi:ATP-dependent RNA circularization protein (DNA/RNA ligase family)